MLEGNKGKVIWTGNKHFRCKFWIDTGSEII